MVIRLIQSIDLINCRVVSKFLYYLYRFKNEEQGAIGLFCLDDNFVLITSNFQGGSTIAWELLIDCKVQKWLHINQKSTYLKKLDIS